MVYEVASAVWSFATPRSKGIQLFGWMRAGDLQAPWRSRLNGLQDVLWRFKLNKAGTPTAMR